MRFQALSQEQSRAMHTRPGVDDGEAEGPGDFLVREPVDVSQKHDGAVVGGQFRDGAAEYHPKLRLASRVVEAHRPVGDRRGVAAVLIEHGKQVVQRDVGAAAATAPAMLMGRVGHDPIEPRAERRVSTKRIDFPYHGKESVLHGFLGILRVPRDPRGQPPGAVTVGSHQILDGHRITPAEGRDERGIPVDPCRYGPAAPIHPFDLLLTV